jgi:hypothetical protein
LAGIPTTKINEEDDLTVSSAPPPMGGEIDPSTGLPMDAAVEGDKNAPPPKQPTKTDDDLYKEGEDDSGDDKTESLLTP